MHHQKIRLGAAALAILLAGCAPAAQEQAAEPESDVILVARSGGGTIELPLRDEAAMRRLQGFDTDPAPSISLTHPLADAVLEPGPLKVGYTIANYEVGQEIGQHVHVILDDRPYEADYDPNGSVTFPAELLTPGTHALTVFLSRPMHLALKNPGAADRVVFHVGAADTDPHVTLDAPTLVYSRPKGAYSRADGSAANIMLDFYLFNVELSPDGTRVRATVDGGQATWIDTWAPTVILTDPAPGEHTIRLELVDAAGNVVPGTTNDTTRTITITE